MVNLRRNESLRTVFEREKIKSASSVRRSLTQCEKKRGRKRTRRNINVRRSTSTGYWLYRSSPESYTEKVKPVVMKGSG